MFNCRHRSLMMSLFLYLKKVRTFF